MGARKQKDRLTDKDRKFCAVLYPDAEDYNCEVALNNLRSNFPRWAYCLHDKDTTDDGELKKPHYHVVVRPIIRKVALVEASAQGESRVADNLRFGGLFTYRFLWLPKYFKYFDSYKAPERPQIDFKAVEGDIIALHPKRSLTPLKNAFRRVDRKEKKQP